MANLDGLLARTRDLQIAPLRKLDDFIFDTSRFQLPDFKNLERLNHRITSNLLFYQTNYFIAIVVLFVVIGLVSKYSGMFEHVTDPICTICILQTLRAWKAGLWHAGHCIRHRFVHLLSQPEACLEQLSTEPSNCVRIRSILSQLAGRLSLLGCNCLSFRHIVPAPPDVRSCQPSTP